MRRGIHPTISQIIVVAVALAVTFAAVSWLWNIWNTRSSSELEGIQLLPGSEAYASNKTLILHLKTHIKPNVVITEVRVSGFNVTNVSVGKVESGSAYIDSEGRLVAKVGSVFVLKVGLDKAPTPGSMINVKLYTETGYVNTWSVQVKT